MTDDCDWVFGYGSLVNRATHDWREAHGASLPGWRRVWRCVPGRRVANLSIEPAEGNEIDGLVAEVPRHDWPALDQRESAYARHRAEGLRHALPCEPATAVYIVPHPAPDDAPELPILLSYLDVVVQGFLSEFGEKGVTRFFDTTTGWETPVLDDRAAPIYPRHQRLHPDERALVDDWLAEVGARIERHP